MPRFRQCGHPDSVTPMRVPTSYSEIDSDDHSSEAVPTPPSSDEHLSPSHKKPLKTNDAGCRTLDQIVEEANLCIASLRAFDCDDPAFDQVTERLRSLKVEYQKVQESDRDNDWDCSCVEEFGNKCDTDNGAHYDEHYDEVSEAGNTIKMNPPLAIGGFSAMNKTNAAVKKPGNVAGGNLGLYLESRMSRERKIAMQSPSPADIVAPGLVKDKIASLADMDGDQDTEQQKRKKWSTVKVKAVDKKSDIASADRSDFQVEVQSPRFRSYVPWLRASVVKEAEKRETEEQVSPKLKTFEEVNHQLREQGELPPYKYSSQHQDYRQPLPGTFESKSAVRQSEVASSSPQPEYPKCLNGWKSCGTCAACTGGDAAATWPANNAPDSKSQEAHRGVPKVKVYEVGSPLRKDSIRIVNRLTPSDVSNNEVNTDSPVGKKEDDSDSGSETVPAVRKLGHPTKSSDVKTATGFASSLNPAAPDDFMVGEFLEIADYKFTRDEAFEILRMCGANLIAAISMYHNARDPDHLRQMLRAWLAPLENEEFEAATQAAKEGRISSEKEVGIEEDECQPIAAVMSVRDAFAILGLEAYRSVDSATLNNSFQSQLAWQESLPQAQEQLQLAYDIISQYQADNDCWELSPSPWTKATNERIMHWKTEDMQRIWGTIGDSPETTAHECKDRFKVLETSNRKPNPPQNSKSKKTLSKASVRTASPDIDAYFCSRCYKLYDGVCDCNFAGSAGEHAEREDSGFPSVNDNSWGPPETIPHISGDGASTEYAASASSEYIPPKSKAPISTAYTVTYWATIESGNKTLHVPIDSSNVTGFEKHIIEGSTGMKKVWKWVQEKSLSDKVSLRDAFDLTKDMLGDDENDNSVVEEPEVAKEIPRAFRHSLDGLWAALSPCDRSLASSNGSVHSLGWLYERSQ